MPLESIGFYTLSDARAAAATDRTPLARAELLITDACNFRCPYCRGCAPEYRGTLPLRDGLETLAGWVADGLRAVRFSGGEPTLHPHLVDFVRFCRAGGVERIAISTNGSRPWPVYEALLAAGVNDFSVSLDACCASTGDAMAGGIDGAWAAVVDTIRRLAERTYVTVGVVLTDENADDLIGTVAFASSLGVADVRVIPAAQHGAALPSAAAIPDHLLLRHPILRYRVQNIRDGQPLRGLGSDDHDRCPLVLDDMAVLGGLHFPCIIYLREGGAPIGPVGTPREVRDARARWAILHDTHADPICSRNCLDVCVDYNNRYRDLRRTPCR